MGDDDDDDDDVHFVLDQHQYHLIFIASSLKQLSIGMHVAPFWHIIPVF